MAGKSFHDILARHPHRRKNLLTGEWILVSPHRMERPWQGKIEPIPPEMRPAYDPSCYLCPENTRAGGAKNPRYDSTFVFTNDFSALVEDVPGAASAEQGLLAARTERGICRVVCFSPRHDLTLAEMSTPEIRTVVETWTKEFTSLAGLPHIAHVQIFENKGELMGCSNPHPHGQIWAEESIPTEPAKELANQLAHLRTKGQCLLCDYLREERGDGTRIVCDNASFVALVPFWAVWPFEIMILSRRHFGDLREMNDTERNDFADLLRRVTARYDNLFKVSFPYSAGIHQSPTDDARHEEWHFHMHFYPPLLRSATIRKFMVGYEMLANPQRDITPEWSAGELRSLSEIHYKKQ